MKVIIAFDGSDTAWRAVERAGEFFGAATAEFLLIHAYVRPVRTGLSAREVTVEELCDEAAAELEEAAEKLRQQGLKARTDLWHGAPRKVLDEVVTREQPDIVVVGARGRSTAIKVLLGSVSSYAVNHLPVPVLVIPAVRPLHDEL